MKKGIAIQTILLLLVGILVVGILVYLVYRASGTSSFSVNECRAKLIDICTMCLNADWDASINTDSNIISECSKYSEFFYWEDNACCGTSCCGPSTCGSMKGDCKALAGIS